MLRIICCTKQFTLLQMTPLLANIFDQDPRILRTLSPSRLSLLSSALSRHLATIAICLVQPSLYLWSSSCCPTDHVTLSLSLQSLRRFCQEPVPPSSQALKLSSRSHPVAVHLRRRPLHPRHESQHTSFAGAQSLERAYCHECVRARCPSNVAAYIS
jgi:hypothetical protein